MIADYAISPRPDFFCRLTPMPRRHAADTPATLRAARFATRDAPLPLPCRHSAPYAILSS